MYVLLFLFACSNTPADENAEQAQEDIHHWARDYNLVELAKAYQQERSLIDDATRADPDYPGAARAEDLASYTRKEVDAAWKPLTDSWVALAAKYPEPNPTVTKMIEELSKADPAWGERWNPIRDRYKAAAAQVLAGQSVANVEAARGAVLVWKDGVLASEKAQACIVKVLQALAPDAHWQTLREGPTDDMQKAARGTVHLRYKVEWAQYTDGKSDGEQVDAPSGGTIAADVAIPPVNATWEGTWRIPLQDTYSSQHPKGSAKGQLWQDVAEKADEASLTACDQIEAQMRAAQAR